MADLDVGTEIGAYVADEIPKITQEDMEMAINQDLIGSNELFIQICEAIDYFIDLVDKYEHSHGHTGSVSNQIAKLKYTKDYIYSSFFKIQNLINAFIGQRIVMTYVHIAEDGTREIRISDNNIEHIQAIEAERWPGGRKFTKLSYVVEDDYKLLSRNIPEGETNNELKLQETAKEVERRYRTYKKRVLWYYPAEWKGYTMNSMGPINEAYVNFYVHNTQLLNSLEGNIDAFMLNSGYGAINADATRGFMIGDVSNNNIQYAVKGIGGSPQGYKEMLKEFRLLKDNGFSKAGFEALIKKYTEEELQRDYKPQIKQLNTASLNNTLGTTLNDFSKTQINSLLKL